MEHKFQVLGTLKHSTKPVNVKETQGGKQEWMSWQDINTLVAIIDSKYVLCFKSHHLYKCTVFLSKDVLQRRPKVQTHKFCSNFLWMGHTANTCWLGQCQKCSKKHYTMIHHKLDTTIHMMLSGTHKSTAIRCNSYTGSLKLFDTGVLLMAIVNVQDVRRCLQKCRCLQDSTSRVSFITDAVVNILGMTRKDYIPLKWINNVASDAIYSVNMQLCCRYSKFQAE